MPEDPQKDPIEALIQNVLKELQAAGLAQKPAQAAPPPSPPAPSASPIPAPRPSTAPAAAASGGLVIDLPDPTSDEARAEPGIDRPLDAEGLAALMDATTSRIGVGRAGPRVRTRSLGLFQADLAVTQDALLRDVDPQLLDEFKLLRVQTRVTGGKAEYLLRPDLGRQLSDEARAQISQHCIKNPNVQICVGDGLSAAAIEANLRKIMPVLEAGFRQAGLSLGTPFFIQFCRVGVMNDIGDLLHPDVLILLIGERPGLGRAESMSAYMAYRPQSGHTDAERDVICNIYDGGGTNPLEAGAFAVQMAQKMIQNQAAGVKLKLLEQ